MRSGRERDVGRWGGASSWLFLGGLNEGDLGSSGFDVEYIVSAIKTTAASDPIPSPTNMKITVVVKY